MQISATLAGESLWPAFRPISRRFLTWFQTRFLKWVFPGSNPVEEGVAVSYDVAADFAVLCANCHRMIHRSGDPSNLTAFRALLSSNQT